VSENRALRKIFMFGPKKEDAIGRDVEGQEAGSYEHFNNHSGSIKFGEFLD
jgi:hypothetical protein